TMEKKDLEAVVAIQGTIIQGPVSSAWQAGLASQAANDSSRCLVAVENDQVIGFVMGEVKNGAFGADRTGWLGYVGVSPKRMGQAIGRALASALFELFAQEGVKNVYTAVQWDSVDMLSFFKSLGFDRSNFINLCKRLK
ncbi:MAG: GNAT family N-acetyltransferase, partial [Deltaproteobacteria bacterium]|nr:GNAT family N-acetyltransferase [Deltaproteobacteria bacterium]